MNILSLKTAVEDLQVMIANMYNGAEQCNCTSGAIRNAGHRLGCPVRHIHQVLLPIIMEALTSIKTTATGHGLNKEIIAQQIMLLCKEDPEMVTPIIEAVTTGVREFARKQSDKSTKIAFGMMDLMEATEKAAINPQHFTRRNLYDMIEPWFEGTNWWKKNRALFTSGQEAKET